MGSSTEKGGGILEVFDRWGKYELVLPRQVTEEMEKGCQEIWGYLRLTVINLMRVQSGLLSIFRPVMFSYSNTGVE